MTIQHWWHQHWSLVARVGDGVESLRWRWWVVKWMWRETKSTMNFLWWLAKEPTWNLKGTVEHVFFIWNKDLFTWHWVKRALWTIQILSWNLGIIKIFSFQTTNLPLAYHQHNTIYHIRCHLDFSVSKHCGVIHGQFFPLFGVRSQDLVYE